MTWDKARKILLSNRMLWECNMNEKKIAEWVDYSLHICELTMDEVTTLHVVKDVNGIPTLLFKVDDINFLGYNIYNEYTTYREN